jgi:hypothetical protein
MLPRKDGLKKEALADQLGGDWIQKKISYLVVCDNAIVLIFPGT